MFEHIVDHFTEFDDDTVHCADGYVTLLNSFDFCFLLKTFNTIFFSTHVVLKTLEDDSFDVQSCLTKVDELYRITVKQKDKFDMVYEKTHALADLPQSRGAQGDVRARYMKLYCSVIDNLLKQIENRFSDHKKLTFLTLMDPQQFGQYSKSFPTDAFTGLIESYGVYFDKHRLYTELAVMYSMSDFAGMSPADIYQFLLQTELKESMPQVYGLTCLVLTIPVSTPSVNVETSVSALERIKTYYRNMTGGPTFRPGFNLNREETADELKSQQQII